MTFIRSTFRCLINYAPALTIVFVYVKIALLLASYSVVWVQPEEFNWRESILKEGTSLSVDDVRGAFNWELFEYAPRSTRPLSSYLEIVDTKLRVLLWRVIPPHPSLSLTWIPLLVVSPWLFYKLLKNLGIRHTTAALTTALYLGNPATLSLLAVDFRPAKALANCAIVACLYWASRIQKSRAESTALRPRSAALLWIFMFGSFFLDETALLAYPAVALFFPRVAFGRRSDAIIAGVLPIATFVAWFYWIPRLTVLAGWPHPTFGQFEPVSSWTGMAAIRTVFQPRWFGDLAINLKIFLSDTFGLVDPRLAATASYFALWLSVVVCVALITWRCVAVVRRERLGGATPSKTDASGPVTLRRAMAGLIGASLCANLLLHSIENRIWGLHWLSTYWPVFFLIVVALALDRADINTLFLSITVCLVVTASMLNFTYVNNAFKQFFYYRTVDFDMVLRNRQNRFRIPPGNDSQMLEKTLEIWKTHRTSERIGEIPTELYYLVHDLRLSKPGYQVNQQWSVFDGHVLEFELAREGGVTPRHIRYMEAIPSKRTGE